MPATVSRHAPAALRTLLGNQGEYPLETMPTRLALELIEFTKAAGLEFHAKKVSLAGYLPVNRTTGCAWLIENEENAAAVVKAMIAAGLDEAWKPRLRFHDLRHTFASLMVATGNDVGFVSRQLGHASTSTTLDVYTHLFDQERHGRDTVGRLEELFGTTLRGKQSASAAS